MARKRINKAEKSGAANKQVSLTVSPQDPGSHEIHVEIKQGLSAKKRRGHKRFAAFLFSVMFLMMFPMARDLISYFQMKQDYQEMQVYNEELKAIKLQLEEERESLHTPEMIERMAREELDMVLPGESKVYQAIPTENIPKHENLRSGEALH